mmetsp:Transcript_5887/g.18110  ORF Transcript_5887/g.18110 Transcript_5887/m.18110 type:complete len:211 (+) Transcript_5887:6883-7515(+)
MLQGSSPVQVDAHRHLHVGRGVPWHPAGVLPARLPQPHEADYRARAAVLGLDVHALLLQPCALLGRVLAASAAHAHHRVHVHVRPGVGPAAGVHPAGQPTRHPHRQRVRVASRAQCDDAHVVHVVRGADADGVTVRPHRRRLGMGAAARLFRRGRHHHHPHQRSVRAGADDGVVQAPAGRIGGGLHRDDAPHAPRHGPPRGCRPHAVPRV